MAYPFHLLAGYQTKLNAACSKFALNYFSGMGLGEVQLACSLSIVVVVVAASVPEPVWRATLAAVWQEGTVNPVRWHC